MSLKPEILSHREQIKLLARQYHIAKVCLFGSVARGDDGADSDIDFLVWPEETTSAFDIIGFAQDTERLLQRKVDVVSQRALHRVIRDQVLAAAEEL